MGGLPVLHIWKHTRGAKARGVRSTQAQEAKATIRRQLDSECRRRRGGFLSLPASASRSFSLDGRRRGGEVPRRAAAPPPLPFESVEPMDGHLLTPGGPAGDADDSVRAVFLLDDLICQAGWTRSFIEGMHGLCMKARRVHVRGF